MRAEPPAARMGGSMTRSLTALFSGATLAILLVASLLLRWSLARALAAEDAGALRENLAALRSSWSHSPDPLRALRQQIVLESAGRRQEPYYLRYQDGLGTVVETPGMARILPAERFAGQGRVVKWRSATGRTYFLLAEPVGEGSGGRLQAAYDVTHDERLVRGFSGALLAVVATGSLLAAGAGYLAARRGLRPLERMSASMRRITAHELGPPIGGDGWPRELADLAAVFDEMLARLEDSFTRLSRFSADLAHELRTPLTNLRGEAEVALSQPTSPAEYREVLASSLEELGRLTTLVDRLLFLARADAGAAALDSRRLDAAEELAAVREFYLPLAEQNGVEVVCAGGAEIQADPVLFRRAVGNLLANSLDHTAVGGRVSLSIRNAGREVEIAVADTGVGIEPEHLPHLTERFYQVDPARARRGAGAGLGLALVKSIVSLHGGRVSIESRPGAGTRVALSFPAPPKMTPP
jgi:two-component system heavy metal sensor histidine kinase CusS